MNIVHDIVPGSLVRPFRTKSNIVVLSKSTDFTGNVSLMLDTDVALVISVFNRRHDNVDLIAMVLLATLGIRYAFASHFEPVTV